MIMVVVVIVVVSSYNVNQFLFSLKYSKWRIFGSSNKGKIWMHAGVCVCVQYDVATTPSSTHTCRVCCSMYKRLKSNQYKICVINHRPANEYCWPLCLECYIKNILQSCHSRHFSLFTALFVRCSEMIFRYHFQYKCFFLSYFASFVLSVFLQNKNTNEFRLPFRHP